MATKTRKMKTVKLDEPLTTAPTRTVVKAGGTGGYFRKVESNVKGGVAVPLSPCTAIVSEKNRAGKTAVLDAIRLALSGAHPVGPHAADLAGLTADGSLPWAKLIGDKSGAEMEFPSGRKTPKHELTGELASLSGAALTNLLPQVAMRDLLTLGTAKAREELFRRFGQGIEELSAEGLDDAQEALFRAMLAQTNGDPVQRVTEAGTNLRSHKRLLSAKLKTQEDEKARLQAEMSAADPLTDEQVEALEAQLRAHDQYKLAETLRAAVTQKAAAIAAGVEQFNQLQAPLTPEEVQEQVAALPEVAAHKAAQVAFDAVTAASKPSERLELLRAVVSLRALNVEHGACITCATVGPANMAEMLAKGRAALAQEEQRAEGQQQALNEASQRLQQAAVNRASAERAFHQQAATYRAQCAALRTQLEQMAEAYKHDLATLESVGGAEQPAESEDALRLALTKARKAKLVREQLSALSASIRETRNEQASAKAVESVLSDTMNDLATGVKARAEKAVNDWMPEGFRAVLQLEDTEGKPTCRWEIVGSDGRSHPRGAASGAEWSALAVAIACAWSDGSPYRFLLLDDTDIAGFSAENVRNLLNGVAHAVQEGRLTQAFVAWSRPSEVPQEGWSVVAL